MGKKAEIKLFGCITDWNENSAANFTARLDEIKAKHDEITLLMHCYGGHVIEANVVGNAIADGNKVSIKILGLAASMGGFLLPYAKWVSIVKNGYVMLHPPMWGGDAAPADELEMRSKVLRNMESDFVAKMAAKTRQKEETVKSWLVGENWFTAQEAKDLGIVDEIIDSVADVGAFEKAEIKALTAQSLYNRFAAVLNTENNQTKIEMNKQEIITRYGLVGVTAESSDADVYAALDKKIQAEKEAREAAEASLKTEREGQINSAVDAAVSAQKITAAQKPKFVAIGTGAGMDALQAALEAIKPTPTITGMLGGGASGGGIPQNRSDWDFEKWQKEDPKGLQAMANTDYEGFNALYKAKFGTDAPK